MSGDDRALVSRIAKIVNEKGLHARAAAKLARTAARYEADILIRNGSFSAAATSIMDLLLLVAHPGVSVTVEARGVDADAAADAVKALIEDGFGELDED